jgi:suppressor of cytokine signaling 7
MQKFIFTNLPEINYVFSFTGTFSFYSQPKSHGASTITEFIEKAMEHSRSGRYLYFLRPRAPGLPPAPIQLLFPVSRFRQVASLQHLCRFLILKQVRRDHISQLPVPSRIIDYLEQTQYYTEFPGEATLEEI